MLMEITGPIHSEVDLPCRWFSDEIFDLIIWEGPENKVPVGFQLIYDKGPKSFVVTLWPRTSQLAHQKLDDGESRPGKPKYSAMVLSTVEAIPKSLAERFVRAGQSIDPGIVSYVQKFLTQASQEIKPRLN